MDRETVPNPGAGGGGAWLTARINSRADLYGANPLEGWPSTAPPIPSAHPVVSTAAVPRTALPCEESTGSPRRGRSYIAPCNDGQYLVVAIGETPHVIAGEARRVHECGERREIARVGVETEQVEPYALE